MKKRKNVTIPPLGLRAATERDDVSHNIFFDIDGSVTTRPGLTELIWPNDPRPLYFENMPLALLRRMAWPPPGTIISPDTDPTTPLPPETEWAYPPTDPFPYDIFIRPNPVTGVTEIVVRDPSDPTLIISTIQVRAKLTPVSIPLKGGMILVADNIPNSVRGDAYSASFHAEGGVPPYRWFVYNGATFSFGYITGTDPTSNGELLNSIIGGDFAPQSITWPGGNVTQNGFFETSSGTVSIPKVQSTSTSNPLCIAVIDSSGLGAIGSWVVTNDPKSPIIDGKDAFDVIDWGVLGVGGAFNRTLAMKAGTGVQLPRWKIDNVPGGCTYNEQTGVISGTINASNNLFRGSATLEDFIETFGPPVVYNGGYMTDSASLTWRIGNPPRLAGPTRSTSFVGYSWGPIGANYGPPFYHYMFRDPGGETYKMSRLKDMPSVVPGTGVGTVVLTSEVLSPGIVRWTATDSNGDKDSNIYNMKSEFTVGTKTVRIPYPDIPTEEELFAMMDVEMERRFNETGMNTFQDKTKFPSWDSREVSTSGTETIYPYSGSIPAVYPSDYMPTIPPYPTIDTFVPVAPIQVDSPYPGGWDPAVPNEPSSDPLPWRGDSPPAFTTASLTATATVGVLYEETLASTGNGMIGPAIPKPSWLTQAGYVFSGTPVVSATDTVKAMLYYLDGTFADSKQWDIVVSPFSPPAGKLSPTMTSDVLPSPNTVGGSVSLAWKVFDGDKVTDFMSGVAGAGGITLTTGLLGAGTGFTATQVRLWNQLGHGIKDFTVKARVMGGPPWVILYAGVAADSEAEQTFNFVNTTKYDQWEIAWTTFYGFTGLISLREVEFWG